MELRPANSSLKVRDGCVCLLRVIRMAVLLMAKYIVLSLCSFGPGNFIGHLLWDWPISAGLPMLVFLAPLLRETVLSCLDL